jgi:hypothetical protein
METIILSPKYRKNKKPVKVRKPSRPLDGINHRLLNEQRLAAEAAKVAEVPAQNDEIDDNAPPSRIELVEKAKELGLKFTKRTSDEKLLEMINTALQGE